MTTWRAEFAQNSWGRGLNQPFFASPHIMSGNGGVFESAIAVRYNTALLYFAGRDSHQTTGR